MEHTIQHDAESRQTALSATKAAMRVLNSGVYELQGLDAEQWERCLDTVVFRELIRELFGISMCVHCAGCHH